MKHDNWFSGNSDDFSFDPFEEENDKNKKRKQRPAPKNDDKEKMEQFEEEQRNYKGITSGADLLRMFFS